MIVVVTEGELFRAAHKQAREMSERIVKLADLNASPLAPGETVDARRHQIAKLGKMLAEAFITIDNIVSQHDTPPSDVTAGEVAKHDDGTAN
jgi:hypothetical protein